MRKKLIYTCTVHVHVWAIDEIILYYFVSFVCTSYPQLIANPHLRAKLTQLLSLIIGTDDMEQQGLLGSSVSHPHIIIIYDIIIYYHIFIF